MIEASNEVEFAKPMRVDDPAQCQFYHRMGIPGIGEVGGQWDERLRALKRQLGGGPVA